MVGAADFASGAGAAAADAGPAAGALASEAAAEAGQVAVGDLGADGHSPGDGFTNPALAAAYGISVMGTFLCTTVLLGRVARHLLHLGVELDEATQLTTGQRQQHPIPLAHLALLRVDLQSAEYWDTANSKMVTLFALAKAAITGKPPTNVGEHRHLGN